MDIQFSVINMSSEELSNKEQWMSNAYISVLVADDDKKNQEVFINNMDFSMDWNPIADSEHPNQDASYFDDPIFMSLIQIHN